MRISPTPTPESLRINTWLWEQTMALPLPLSEPSRIRELQKPNRTEADGPALDTGLVDPAALSSGPCGNRPPAARGGWANGGVPVQPTPAAAPHLPVSLCRALVKAFGAVADGAGVTLPSYPQCSRWPWGTGPSNLSVHPMVLHSSITNRGNASRLPAPQGDPPRPPF